MKLITPILKLRFLGNDLKPNRPIEQAIGNDGIINRSISISYQLMSNLKSSSSQAHISILGSHASVNDIIATEGDIKAELLDGNKLIFTGFLSTSYIWSVTDYGESALSLTLEDVGTRKLQKAFIDKGVHLFECIADEAIRRIASKAGISLSLSFPVISTKVSYLVAAGKACKDLLSELFYELGYVYYFNENGELEAYKLDCSNTDSIPIIDKNKLFSVGGNAITLSKNLMQYSGVRISYKELGKASNYLVYRNATNKGNGHPYCYLPLESNQYFDGNEVCTPKQGEEIIPPRIAAVNASCEAEIVGSNKIISISNLRQQVSTDSGNIKINMNAVGGPYLEIKAHNTGYLKYHITRLDAYADIVYEKSENIISVNNDNSNNSKPVMSEDMKWIHSKDDASRHANLVAQYNKNSGSRYSFYSDEKLEVGSIVKLADSLHSGLFVTVLIYAKTVTDESAIAAFSAVGIEPFNLADKVFIETFIDKKPNDKGEDGKSYTIVIHSDNGNVFRLDNIKTTLFCQVLENNIDITSTLEPWRFNWTRVTSNPAEDEKWNTSAKAIGHKTIDITDTDCLGRTVFSCSVEL